MKLSFTMKSTGKTFSFDSSSLDLYISQTMQKANVPGLSITISKNGETVYSRGYGHRDTDNREPATENTLYGIGSVTKSFTSMALMLLSEKGLIDINKPVRDYLSKFHPDEASEETTIAHLMSHSSGFPGLNTSEVMLFREVGKDTSYIPMAGFEDFMYYINGAAGERHSPPGNRFFYWNEGYTMLGRIIEKLSGMKYHKYIRENILEPLGIKRATFFEEEAFNDPDHATPYYREQDGTNTPSRISDEEIGHAPGGLVTSTVELSKYLSLWTADNKKKIVGDTSLQELVKPRIKTFFASHFDPVMYGYGWMSINNFLGKRLISHSGSVAASSGYVGFLPELNVSVAIGANTSDCPTSRIGMYALSLFIEGASADDLPFVKIDKKREMLKGDYHDYRDYTRVSLFDGDDGLLKMKLESDEFHTTVPVLLEGDKVYTINNNAKMEIEVRMKNDRDVEIYFERHRFQKK